MSVKAAYASQALSIIRDAKIVARQESSEALTAARTTKKAVLDQFTNSQKSAAVRGLSAQKFNEVLDGTRDITTALPALRVLNRDVDWVATVRQIEEQVAALGTSGQKLGVLVHASKGLSAALRSDLPNVDAIVSRAIGLLTSPEASPQERALGDALIALQNEYAPKLAAEAKATAASDSDSAVDSSFQPDFVNIGMGPTGMMSMLSALAAGRTVAGVEIRGEPLRGVHMNIREDWYHMLGKIDEQMLERYGAERLPQLHGEVFSLADFFYNNERAGGHLDFPEIFKIGDEQNQNVAGRLQRISFEDARDKTKEKLGGKSQVVLVKPPEMPEGPDPSKLSGDMEAVLDSPSTFQAALINFESIMRAYLHEVQRLDAEAGVEPRLQIYTGHRVVQEDGVSTGYMDAGDGKKRILIEEISTQRDENGKASRGRKPGTKVKDLGVPTKWALTAGFGGGADAKTLGYEQKDVTYDDPFTGEEIVARQTWIAGEVTANVGGQLIRRISTETDPETGEQETVRQIAVGHEKAPNVAWTLVQVPDFVSFDPIDAGLVPEGTDPKSEEHVEAQQSLIYEYYVRSAGEVMHIDTEEIKDMRMFYGPNMFTLTERVGESAKVAENGVVAGDLMGNGHFLTSGGAMTGMIGHSQRFLEFWEGLDRGEEYGDASKKLEDGILTDTQAWLNVSHKEFLDVSPINFGAERAEALGLDGDDSDRSKGSTRDIGLARLLATNNWAQSFQRLRAGEFGEAGKDFYVPSMEVDVIADPTKVNVDVAGPVDAETADGLKKTLLFRAPLPLVYNKILEAKEKRQAGED